MCPIRNFNYEIDKSGMYITVIKPLFDKVVAFVILVATSPFFLLTVICLLIANKGSVWFLQERPGQHGKIFTTIKFKTMTNQRDSAGELLSDEKRLTSLGKWIRGTSMDELPQLINVLLGNMSIVGPRPLLKEYLPLYDQQQRRRHNIKPGITGWAQVNGRNAISWKQKFAYDIWYVDHISFWLDIKILFLTVIKVFKSEGISSENSVTAEKFHGNE